jgi:hypothetical protein
MQNINHKIGFEDKRLSFADNWRKSQKIVIITLVPSSSPRHNFFYAGHFGDADLGVCRIFLQNIFGT